MERSFRRAGTLTYQNQENKNMSDLTLTTLAHDKDMARDFLAALDLKASKFTFQFFSDRRDGRHADVFHGTLDEVSPKVQQRRTRSGTLSLQADDPKQVGPRHIQPRPLPATCPHACGEAQKH